MKLTAQTSVLSSVLKQVCRVAIRNAGDIYGHVLVDVSDGQLSLSAHNGKQQITLHLPRSVYEVQQLGAVCVHAAKFEQVIASLPKDKPVVLSQAETKLTISCGRSRFNLAVLHATDFPEFDLVAGDVHGRLGMKGEALTAAIRQVGFCAARSDVRHYLNGVCFDVSPGQLTLAATDGHRLGVTSLNVEGDAEGQFILPSTCIEDVAAFCASGDLQIEFSKQMVCFKSALGVMFSKLVDGTFPQYKGHVAAAEKGEVARVQRDEITSAVARVSLLSDSKVPAVKLSVGADAIEIQSISSDVENAASDVLPCDYASEPLVIGLNGALTAELLRSFNTDHVDLHFNGPASGTLLRASGSPSHSFVLMPVRL